MIALYHLGKIRTGNEFINKLWDNLSKMNLIAIIPLNENDFNSLLFKLTCDKNKIITNSL